MAPTQEQTKNTISELLRSADRAIKDGKLAQALDVVTKVFELDPRNIYALAYRERILYLTDVAAKEQAVREKAEEEERKRQPVQEPPPPVLEKRPTPPRTPPEAPPPPIPEPTEKPKKSYAFKKSPAAMEAYRTFLREAWEDGGISPEEQLRMDSMRDTFGITEADHVAADRDVRIELYLEDVKKAWQNGVTTFDDIKNRYRLFSTPCRAIIALTRTLW